MDGAMTKAPLGGEKTGPNPTDRAKDGVKRSLLCEGAGVPIGLAVEGANRHDMRLVAPTLKRIPVDRPRPTRKDPQGLCLDKGYDYDEIRGLVGEFGYREPTALAARKRRPSSARPDSKRAGGS